MATRLICDRDGKEISGRPYTLESSMKETYDLCQECRIEFGNFMKGGAVVPDHT